MKRIADHSFIALGCAAVFSALSGQAAPPVRTPPAAGERVAPSAPDAPRPDLTPRVPREHNHAWQHAIDRPAQTVGPRLTPEMINLCMEVARDIDEDLAKQLAVLRERDFREFESRLRRSRRLTALAELKQRDATGYNLKITELRVDATVSRLASEVRAARRAERPKEAQSLEQDLQGQVILQLAFRYRARENYLCQLRELVERLERELEKERDDFDHVLSDRMAELLRDPVQPEKGTEAPDHDPVLDMLGMAMGDDPAAPPAPGAKPGL